MSDLSRMLDDLYAVPDDGDAVSDETATGAVEWPSEELEETPTRAVTWLTEELEDTPTPAVAWPSEELDETPTRAPSWSSEEALDEVFSSWVPGTSEGATAFERSLVEERPATLAEALHVDVSAVSDWLAETEPVPEPVSAGLRRWSPSDDDILPAHRRGRRRS